jgi:2-(1,2-epoxy-1,2-dihydrophenyl)acetyl-CoA isomerase
MFEAAQSDASVRCILIDGKGAVFSAGGDIGAFAKSLDQDAGSRQADFARRLQLLGRLVEAVAGFDRPIVAAVRGAVAGAGLLYPLIADYAIGDPSAKFAFAHQKVGLSPDGGVSHLLPQVVGQRMARTLLLTAATVDATEAHRIGLLNRLVAAEELEPEASAVARRFAAAPQRAIVSAKRLVNAAGDRSLHEQLAAETEQIVACVGDADFAEGVRSFLEKRRADFPSARGASADKTK